MPEKIKKEKVTGIACPKCHQRQTQVIDSRATFAEWEKRTTGNQEPEFYNARRRRHLCLCGNRFTTYELVLEDLGKLKAKKFSSESLVLEVLNELSEFSTKLTGIIKEHKCSCLIDA